MRLLLGLLLAAVCAVAQAQRAPAATPTSGREYIELNPARPVSTGEQLEVLEFFYYGCPVCYEAQPHIARWLSRAGPGVAIIRVPAPFSESAESFARTFYALSAMNQIARLHWPIYDNHHFDDKKLHEEKNIVAWAGSNGVDRERFAELRKSPEIQQRVDAAKKALETYEVKGVPTFVIDGKYQTSARMAGGTREMMNVVEFLVDRAAAERKK